MVPSVRALWVLSFYIFIRFTYLLYDVCVCVEEGEREGEREEGWREEREGKKRRKREGDG